MTSNILFVDSLFFIERSLSKIPKIGDHVKIICYSRNQVSYEKYLIIEKFKNQLILVDEKNKEVEIKYISDVIVVEKCSLKSLFKVLIYQIMLFFIL